MLIDGNHEDICTSDSIPDIRGSDLCTRSLSMTPTNSLASVANIPPVGSTIASAWSVRSWRNAGESGIRLLETGFTPDPKGNP